MELRKKERTHDCRHFKSSIEPIKYCKLIIIIKQSRNKEKRDRTITDCKHFTRDMSRGQSSTFDVPNEVANLEVKFSKFLACPLAARVEG